MNDVFSSRAGGQEGSATGGFAIVADNDADLDTTTRAIYVGTGGTLAVALQRGDILTFHNVPDGALLPVRATRVLETTTATQLIGLY